MTWAEGDLLTPTNLNNKGFGGNIFNAKDYGAIGNGVADDAASIRSSVSAAQAAGGGIVFLSAASYNIGSTITISQSGVRLCGQASAFNTDVGSIASGTQLQWSGAIGAPMIAFSPTIGASAQALKRVGASDLILRGQNAADTGLLVQSVQGGRFERLYIDGCRVVGLDLSSVTQLGENRDNQQSFYDSINVRQLSGSSASGAICIRLDGDGTTGTNVSNNDFLNISVLHYNGVGVQLNNCDSNRFWSLKAYNAAGTTSAATGIVFSGGTASGLECRSNLFGFVSSGSRGLTVQTGTAPSRDNTILYYSRENGEPIPIVESSATLHYGGNKSDWTMGTLTLSGNGLRTKDGTAAVPSQRFSNEDTLGWYRSAASTMALSYGSLNLRGAALSLRTTNSAGSTSALTNGELCLVAVSATSAQIAWRSGNTTYLFNANVASP